MAQIQPARVAQSRYGLYRNLPGVASTLARAAPPAPEGPGAGYTPEQLAFLERMESNRAPRPGDAGSISGPVGAPPSTRSDVVRSSHQTTSPEIMVQGGS